MKAYLSSKNESDKKSRLMIRFLAIIAFSALFSLAKPAEVRAINYTLCPVTNGQITASEINEVIQPSATEINIQLTSDSTNPIVLDMDQDLTLNCLTTYQDSGSRLDLIIKGNGKLTIDTSGSGEIITSAINANNLTIESGKLILSSNADTISIKNNFTMNGGSLTATSTSTGYFFLLG